MSVDLEALRQAAAKDPSLLVKLADSLVAAGFADEAIKTCRKALATRPDDVPLRLALGRALSAAGHLEEAQAALLDAAARERKRSAAAAAPPPAKETDPDGARAYDFDSAPTRRASMKELQQGVRSPSGGWARMPDASPRAGRTDPTLLAERDGVERADPTELDATGPDTDQMYVSPHADTARGGVDLEAVAAALLGGEGSRTGWTAEEVVPEPPVDEMAILWDRRRARAFVWLWVSLALVTAGIVGGTLYRASQKKKAIDALVARADARSLEATDEAELAARDDWAQAVRMEPHARSYFAMSAYGHARLAADEGEDTDAAGWAMLKRAEKEHKRHPDPDARADRDERQARALLALERGEACTPTEDADGDIAARCALQKGDVEGARRVLGQQIAGGRDAVRALLVLASLELGAGDLDAADRAYTQVLERAPNHPRALVGRALVALERGESPQVTPPPGRLGPTTDAWFHLAAGLAELNRPKGDEAAAFAELDQARRGIIHDGRLALLYGRARLSQGKVTEAEEAMRIAERLDPNDGDVAVLDAEVALAKGYEDKVASTMQAGTSPRQLAVLGRALCLVGRYKEAEADLKAALARRPGDAIAITYLAITRAHLGDQAGAMKSLERAAATLGSTTPHYGLGLLAYERHDLGRARSELEKALAHNSESFRARALLGRVLGELGKSTEALAELERVAREAPALLPVHATLGRLYLTLGRDREARAQLRQVIDAGKATADDKLAYAEATIDLGIVDEGDKALADAAEAGALAPRLARLRLLLSSWKGPKDALAVAKTLEKERRGPAARDAKLALAAGDAWRRAGDPKKAAEDYSAALLGDALHANLGLGRVQLLQNDLVQAETSFRAALQAWERGPYGVDDQTEARVGLGRVLLGRKALDEAQKTLEPCVSADPTAPEPHYWLARVDAERGLVDKARAEAERATQLDDRYAEAFALLGDLAKGADSAKARHAYKRYLELSPEGDKAKAIKRALASLK